MSVLAATYNVLANAYIRPDWYPLTPPALLRAEHRVPRIAERLEGIGADILCLQEVEPSTMNEYAGRLARSGYTGRFAQRPGKPDGCAIFIRGGDAAWHSHEWISLDAAGLPKKTRRIAQIARIDVDNRRLGIVNAHIEWDAPETPAGAQIAPRQVALLLNVRSTAPACAGWIVCGDFNATPDSNAVAAMREAGFTFSHVDRPAATCNANRKARTIDFIFHDAALVASPLPVAVVTDDSALPGPDEPSDHVPVVAQLEWRAR